MAKKQLGQILLELKLITDEQLQTALVEQKQWKHPLGRTLIELEMVDEETIIRVLSHQLKLPAVELSGFEPDRAALRLLDADFCRNHSCLPLRFREDRRLLHIAMSDHHFYDKIRARARCNLRPYLAGPVSIERAIQRLYLDSQSGSPALRSDEQVFSIDHGNAGFDDGAMSEGLDPTDYFDLDLGADAVKLAPAVAADPAPTAQAPATPPPATEQQQIRELKLQIAELQIRLSRLAELLVSKGVCLSDELSEIIRS